MKIKILVLVAMGFLLLAATFNQARAEDTTVMTTANKAGGLIHVTATICGDKAIREAYPRIAYSTAPDGTVVLGCWGVLDGQIVVRYSDDTFRLYPMSQFTVTPYGDSLLDQMSKNKAKPRAKGSASF